MERLLLSELLGMGFPEVRATKALAKTNYVGIEAAVNWLVEHADDDDIDIPLELLEGSRGEPSRTAAALGVAAPFDVVTGVPSDLPIVTNPDDSQMAATVIGVSECKVVLVVPTSLGMSAGKIGAQCAHAILGLYRLLLARRVPWLTAWEDCGEKTVVLAVESGGELLELGQAAAQLQLPSYLVYDAGRTEVASGTATVLAVGGVAEVVDRVTGHLSTLR